MKNPYVEAKKRARKKLKKMGVKVITPEMERGMAAAGSVMGSALERGMSGKLMSRDFTDEIHDAWDGRFVVKDDPSYDEPQEDLEEIKDKILQEMKDQSKMSGPMGKLNERIVNNLLNKSEVKD